MSQTLEWIIAGLYLLVGPFAWVLYAFGAFKGRARFEIVPDPLPELPASAPLVSVVVPCKDGEAQIEACVRSIQKQDYPNLEIVVIDDRSTDRTGAILDEIARSEPRLKVIHNTTPPPAGWMGKTNALQIASKSATGEWMIFVDSDTTLEPLAVRTGVSTGIYRQFDLVSLIPHFDNVGFWEQLVTPLCASATTAMFAMQYANSAQQPNIAFACGQYMAIRRDVFDWMGGYEVVKNHFSDDIGVARYLKQNGKRPRIGWGQHLVKVRLYSSLSETIRGWSRNFYFGVQGKPVRIALLVLFTLVCMYSFFAALAWGIYRNAHPVNFLGGWGWIATAVVHIVLMTAGLAVSYKWSGNSPKYGFFWPIGAAVVDWISIKALWLCVTRKVEWRGTSYDHRANPHKS